MVFNWKYCSSSLACIAPTWHRFSAIQLCAVCCDRASSDPDSPVGHSLPVYGIEESCVGMRGKPWCLLQDPLSPSVKRPGTLGWHWLHAGRPCALEAKSHHCYQAEKQFWVQLRRVLMLPAMRQMGLQPLDISVPPIRNMNIWSQITLNALQPLRAQQNLVKFNCFQESADTAAHLKTRGFNAFSIDSGERRGKGLFCLKILDSSDTFKMCLPTYSEIATNTAVGLQRSDLYWEVQI